MSKIISIVNQKGGVGKTTTCVNLGVGLVRKGKKVLLIDASPQGSLTISLGINEPDRLDYTLSNVLMDIVNEEELPEDKGILHHKEGVDFVPGNIELAGIEVSLVNVMSREVVLKEFIQKVKDNYDYIIIDCMPSLGMITINAFACADSVIIPVQVSYLSAKGIQQLINTIARVRMRINPSLRIMGILLTMTDFRTNYAKDIKDALYETYKDNVFIFDNYIPHSVRAAEICVAGESIFSHDPNGKVAEAYEKLTEEILGNLKKKPETVKNYSDDEAAVIMVDTNIQREEILPSEKAKAYKMKYDALKNMGKGNRLELMQENENENIKKIQRYIWMANLNEELLEMVDKRLLKFIPAVNISFLTEEEQNWLVNIIKRLNIYPGTEESEVLKQKSKNNELKEGDIWEVLSPEVKNKPRKITIKSDRLNYYFPDTYTETDIENIIIEQLDDWKSKHDE